MRKVFLCIILIVIMFVTLACSKNLSQIEDSVIDAFSKPSIYSSEQSLPVSVSQSVNLSSLDSVSVSSDGSLSNSNSDENSQNSSSSVSESLKPTESSSSKPAEPQIQTKTYILSQVDRLCVRSSNSVNSGVLGYLDSGDVCVYISKVGDFYKTKYKEKTAYVSIKYSKKVEYDLSTDKVEKAIDFGCTLLGYPYVFGSQRYHWGNGVLNKNFKNGEFDCSAFVQYIYYKSCGVILDVTSRKQSLNGTKVSINNLQRGDLMFFTNDSRKNKTGIERIGHVGIYFGDNYILHTASDYAVIEEISAKRWSYFITARRVV